MGIRAYCPRTGFLVAAFLAVGNGWAVELIIRPNPNADWQADPENVKAVLESAAQTLARHFPERKIAPILVEPRGGPIVLYERGDNGEYRVRLDTGETYWSQYAFQFAHEMGHILSDYKENPHRNKWFEEAICETASLYALREMAKTWKTDAPYENWRGYAPSLAAYAQERIDSAQLPDGKPLAGWFADHEADLYVNSTNRELNLVVAAQLLPLFESEPAQWEAISWLNAADSAKSQTLAEYLADWERSSPERHRAFIREIAVQFAK
jgi:hypothetical protein